MQLIKEELKTLYEWPENPLYKGGQDESRLEEEELEERSLTSQEKSAKEKYVKGMKPKQKEFEKRYGKEGKSVMYATATKRAKETA